MAQIRTGIYFSWPIRKPGPTKENPNSLISPLHLLSWPPTPDKPRRSREPVNPVAGAPARPRLAAPRLLLPFRAASEPVRPRPLRPSPARPAWPHSLCPASARPAGGLLAPAVLPDARQGPDGGPSQVQPRPASDGQAAGCRQCQCWCCRLLPSLPN